MAAMLSLVVARGCEELRAIPLRVLCLHGARAFVNTKHAATIQRIDRYMWVDCYIEALERLSLDFDPLTALSQRRIQIRAQVEDGREARFSMSIKRLGIFGEGATAGCLASFLVHYRYLRQKWIEYHEETRRLEIAAAEICRGADSEASVWTQQQFADRAADLAMTQDLT